MSEIISWGMRFNPSALSCAEAPGAVALEWEMDECRSEEMNEFLGII